MSSERGATARFTQGDRVRVSRRYPTGHHRTPWYIKGRTGRVDTVYKAWVNPESRAYGHDGLPKVPLYRVEFDPTDLWQTYDGLGEDRICADVFEHWLERA